MELKYLYEFVSLTKTGNYLETAADLFISQSSLSKHIMTLEKELGFPLFERTTRKIKLTEGGRLLLPYAQNILQQWNSYTEAYNRASRAQKNMISIASTTQMTLYNVTDILALYKRHNLDVSLNVVIEPHTQLKKLLLQHKVDFIWIGETEEEKTDTNTVARIPFLIDPLVALIPKNHPLASCNQLSMEQLAKYEILMQDNSSVEQCVFLKMCHQLNLNIRVNSVPGGKVLSNLVKQGFGIAVMLKTPAINVTGDDTDTTLKEIIASPLIHVNLLYLKNSSLSPIAKDFLRFFKKQLSDS